MRYLKFIVNCRESNALYCLVTKNSKSSTLYFNDKKLNQLIPSSSSLYEDVMTIDEVSYYDDRNETVIVSKRDTDSSHPVRVATMDFFIPEKAPQPNNVLESLVWDREKEIDRVR